MRALGTIAVLLFVTSCTVGNGRRVVPTSPGDEGDETDGAVATETDEGGGCSCTTGQTPGGSMVLMLLGFVGLGAMRRRRA